ncbi:SUI1A [Auxenochlorella protothecoides x Auxenochlorella symbiontica]
MSDAVVLPAPSLGGFDPFADAGDNDVKGKDAKDYVHVRVQQRNGKKCLTTVQGLPKKFDLDKILKALKKEYCCNGTVVEDKELGKVLQLQGDQRKNVSAFLIGNDLTKKDAIKVHGF